MAVSQDLPSHGQSIADGPEREMTSEPEAATVIGDGTATLRASCDSSETGALPPSNELPAFTRPQKAETNGGTPEFRFFRPIVRPIGKTGDPGAHGTAAPESWHRARQPAAFVGRSLDNQLSNQPTPLSGPAKKTDGYETSSELDCAKISDHYEETGLGDGGLQLDASVSQVSHGASPQMTHQEPGTEMGDSRQSASIFGREDRVGHDASTTDMGLSCLGTESSAFRPQSRPELPNPASTQVGMASSRPGSSRRPGKRKTAIENPSLRLGKDQMPTSSTLLHTTDLMIPAAMASVSHDLENRPVARNASREMNEILQIIAHTWSKSQASFNNEHRGLGRRLRDAVSMHQAVSEQLERTEQRNKEQSVVIASQRSQLETFQTRVASFKTFVQGLGTDMNALRKEATAHRHLLEEHKEKATAYSKVNSTLVAEYATRSNNAMNLTRELMKLVEQLRWQLHDSTTHADLLLVQLDEKTVLLTLARDETNTLRNAKPEPMNVSLDEIVVAIKSGQQDIMEKVERALSGPGEASSITSAISEIHQVLQAHKASNATEFAPFKDVVQGLAEQMRNWSEKDSACEGAMKKSIIESVKEHLTNIFDENKSDVHARQCAADRQMQLQQEVSTLQAKLETANKRIVDSDLMNNYTKSEMIKLKAEIDTLKTQIGKASLHKGSTASLEAETLTKEVEVAKSELSYKVKQLSKTLASNAHIQEEVDALRRTAEGHRSTVDNLTLQRDELQHKLNDVENAQARSAKKFLAEQQASFENEMRRVHSEHERAQDMLKKLAQEKTDIQESLLEATTESQKLAEKMRHMTEEQAQCSQTALLEEELAMMHEQVDIMKAAEAGAKFALEAEQEKAEGSVTALRLHLAHHEELSTQARSEMAKLKESYAETVGAEEQEWRKRLESLQETLAGKEAKCAQIEAEATRFRADVDRMWQAEEQRTQGKIVELQVSIEQLRLKKAEADDRVQVLCQKLETAELSVAELQRTPHPPKESPAIDAVPLRESRPISLEPSTLEEQVSFRAFDQRPGSTHSLDSMVQAASAFLTDLPVEHASGQLQDAHLNDSLVQAARVTQSSEGKTSAALVSRVDETPMKGSPLIDEYSQRLQRNSQTDAGPCREPVPLPNISSKRNPKKYDTFRTPEATGGLQSKQGPQPFTSSPSLLQSTMAATHKLIKYSDSSFPGAARKPSNMGTRLSQDPRLAAKRSLTTPKRKIVDDEQGQGKRKRLRSGTTFGGDSGFSAGHARHVPKDVNERSSEYFMGSQTEQGAGPKTSVNSPISSLPPGASAHKRSRTASRATKAMKQKYDERFDRELSSNQPRRNRKH